MKKQIGLCCAAAMVLGSVSLKAGEDGVVIDTVRYDTSYDYPSHLYIIRPAGVEGKLPCIMYVKGSAWKKQNMKEAVRRMTVMARMGYVVACVEYRPCSVALFPAQVEDFKTAVRFMRAHADEYGVDTGNMFSWGGSSGGHTVLLSAFTQDSRLLDSGRLGEWSCEVKAVVDCYGPSELVYEFRIESGVQRDPDANGGLLLGDPVEEKRDVALKASPMYYVHPCSVPLFVLHGDSDKVVPVAQSRWLVERCRECGTPCEYLEIPGAGHGTAEFWTPETYARVDAFFRRFIDK